VRIPELIERKRRGERLSRVELEALVLGFTSGEVPDYQVAAWLMAVCWRGMEPQEVAELTDVMASSGRRLDLSPIGRTVGEAAGWASAAGRSTSWSPSQGCRSTSVLSS
jgi:pyrimidine-nucleoside phosphorylase